MFYVLGLGACYLFYKLGGYTVVKNKVVEKYKKFRELNKLVSRQYKTVGMILYVSICMVLKMYWINFLQWSNNSIEVLNKKNISISYILNGKIYKVLIKAKKGPNLVLLVTDENNEDVTDIVLPYLGPNNDWHHNFFKPCFWNKKFLCFELSSGEMKSFKEDDTIILE
jgi:hypothetical protein